MLNAIQQGILTKSTKTRLEELEDRKEELETLIACEKLAKPKISAEFMTFWLHRFRELDVKKKEHRQMLIDAFVNAIFLYDDKVLITFNYKEGSKTITFDDVKDEASTKASGSDIDCSAAPKSIYSQLRMDASFYFHSFELRTPFSKSPLAMAQPTVWANPASASSIKTGST